MRLADGHHDCLTRTGQDGTATEAETHPAGEDRELFLLDGMSMARGDVRTRRQKQIEDEQLAAGFRGGLTDHDALAADRVLNHALLAGNHGDLRTACRAAGVNSNATVTSNATRRLK